MEEEEDLSLRSCIEVHEVVHEVCVENSSNWEKLFCASDSRGRICVNICRRFNPAAFSRNEKSISGLRYNRRKFVLVWSFSQVPTLIFFNSLYMNWILKKNLCKCWKIFYEKCRYNVSRICYQNNYVFPLRLAAVSTKEKEWFIIMIFIKMTLTDNVYYLLAYFVQTIIITYRESFHSGVKCQSKRRQSKYEKYENSRIAAGLR